MEKPNTTSNRTIESTSSAANTSSHRTGPPSSLSINDSDYEAIERRKERRELYSRYWPLANVPARAASRIKTGQFQCDEWQKANAKLAWLFENGVGTFVALSGPRGTGKTQLAACAMDRICRDGRTVRYVKAIDFFCEVKATFSPHVKETESDVINRYAKPRLLVVDGVEERGHTCWEDRMLSLVIDRRYDAMLDTILVTNEREEEFVKSIGPSAASRLQETGGIILCAWPSFREKERDA